MSEQLFWRFLVFFAGLFGAAGVALAALASHGDPANLRYLGPAAAMYLIHAAALLAVSAVVRRPPMLTLAAACLGGGTVLFSGDLVKLAFMGVSLFPMAAPIGGTLMILGWCCVALAAFGANPLRA